MKCLQVYILHDGLSQGVTPFYFVSVQMKTHSRWLYKCRIVCWFLLCTSLDIFFTTSFSLSTGPPWSCFLGLYPLGFPRHCPVLVDILLIGSFDGSPFSPFGYGFQSHLSAKGFHQLWWLLLSLGIRVFLI